MTAANVSEFPAKPGKKAAAAAREAEAADGYLTIEQCGVTLKIPMGDKVPFSATLRFMGLNDDLTPLGENENRDLLGTRLLLGAEQWAAFLEKNPTTEDFNAIGRQVEKFSGN